MAQTGTLFLLAALLVGGLFSLPSPDLLEASVRKTYDGGEYQQELPGLEARGGDGQPAGDGEIIYRRRRVRSDEAVLRDVGTAILWVLFAVAAVLAALWVARRLPGREARVSVPDAIAVPGPVPASPSVALADAEALAAAGRHDEAIHVLLLVAVEELSRRDRLAVSATSREILDELQPERGVYDALGRLVTAVEWSLFGGRKADADAYERCRASYLVLHAKLGGTHA